MPTVGSLFSGAGLLDLGLHLAGFEHAWLCESDPWRRDLLRTRFPGVPVHDDVRTLRGQAAADTELGPAEVGARNGQHRPRRRPDDSTSHPLAAPVDLIAGGFPCKGASSAGKRNGFEHPETALWFEMRRVIRELRPRAVLIENVGDIRGMAAAAGEPPGSLWGTVLGDLATLGFGDIRWDCVPAGAIGAPHLRDRVFAVATQSARADADQDAAADTDEPGREQRCRPIAGAAQLPAAERARADAADTTDAGRIAAVGQGQQRGMGRNARAGDDRISVDWGEYAPAIHRWEAIHGAAPEPLIRRMDDGDPGVRRMRARVDRSRLSALGDGVHVHCAWLVGEYVMGLFEEEAVAT
jgi:DNA (cytosine-5)-methyltransferase 1